MVSAAGGRVIPIRAAVAPADAPARHAAGGAAAGAAPLQPPLSLYIHVPWCVRKCPYCDFNSHALDPSAPLPESAYLAALRADLESTLPLVWGRSVHSIFIGGGTPSLLGGEAVARLLSDVRALLPVSADAEITLEANPGTFEAGRYAAFRAAGVNRLSIGVQSFDDARLRGAGPRARRRPGAARGRRRGRDVRELQPGPDDRPAGADGGAGAARHRAGAAERAAAPVDLPADAGA